MVVRITDIAAIVTGALAGPLSIDDISNKAVDAGSGIVALLAAFCASRACVIVDFIGPLLAIGAFPVDEK